MRLNFKPFLFENAHSGAFSSAESDFATHIENARRCNKKYKTNRCLFFIIYSLHNYERSTH